MEKKELLKLKIIMKTSDLFSETYLALISNKARSGLTILGIVIGIGSVIAMVSIGQGAQGSIESSIQTLGSNLVLVTPGQQRGPGVQVSQGRGSAQSLKQSDADAIAQEITLASAVAPELSSRYQITAKGTNTNTSVIGTTAAYPAIRNVAISSGTFISDQNVKSLARVAVIGPTIRDDLFDNRFKFFTRDLWGEFLDRLLDGDARCDNSPEFRCCLFCYPAILYRVPAGKVIVIWYIFNLNTFPAKFGCDGEYVEGSKFWFDPLFDRTLEQGEFLWCGEL